MSDSTISSIDRPSSSSATTLSVDQEVSFDASFNEYMEDDNCLEVPDSPRILVVDDDEVVLQAVIDSFEKQFEVTGTKSPKEAIAMLREMPYEIILSDLMMEEMYGLDFIRAAKDIRPSTAAIVFTGYASKEAAVRSLKEGVYDFLEKPLTTDMIVGTVMRAWRGLRVELENRKLLADLRQMNKALRAETKERKAVEDSLNRACIDLKLTQSQLIQSAKLAAIGELAAGVAHELNQPLMVIRGIAQLMMRKLRKAKLKHDELKENLDVVERNTKRMMNIIKHLRTFSRQSNREISPQDINKLIDNCFLMVGEQLRLHNIEVKKSLAPDLSKVKGDASQLEQIFLNLIINAKDAIEEKNQKVQAHRRKANYQGILEIVTKTNEKFVEILVKDNGTGISAENREKIFDPFYTTKEVGEGTGLGLSITYGIIKDHKGQIEVAETGPEGTTFRIKLPQ